MLEQYKRLNDALETLIIWFTGALMAVIVILPFAGTVIRLVTGEGYTWVAESPPQLVPWVVFPLIGVLLRHDDHIAVDVVPHFLRGRSLAVLRVVVLAISLAAAVAFAVFGARTVMFFQKLGQLSTTEIEFPLWYLYVSYPIGFALAANFCLEAMLREMAGKRTRGAAAELPPAAL